MWLAGWLRAGCLTESTTFYIIENSEHYIAYYN